MYGSLFGRSSGGAGRSGSTTPHAGSTHHHHPTGQESAVAAPNSSNYVEASSSSSSAMAGGDGVGVCNKTLNTQISLPPFRHSSTRSSAGGDVGTALLSQSQQQEEQQRGGGATILSCVINLANTIIGAGMLGLPGALGGTGDVGGTILMVLGALFSAHGLSLLSKAAQTSGSVPRSSFYTVAKASVPHYTILIDLAVALKCFGVATGYLITVGDCMVDALDHIIMTKETLEEESTFIQTILSRQFWVVGATLAVLPVSFYRTLDELKKASALALVFVVMLVFGIVAYANQWGNLDPCGIDHVANDGEDDSCVGDMESFTNLPRTLAKLPIFVFAFTCHQNIFPIVNEIQHQPQPHTQPVPTKALPVGQQQQSQSQRKINTIIGLSIGLAFGVFLLVALEGYNTFGANVRGDILLNYPETGMVTILRMCIAFMLTLHYPLQLDPSRRCITSLIQVIHKSWFWQRVFGGSSDTATNRAYHRRNSDLPEEEEGAQATEQSTFSSKDPSNPHSSASEYTNPSPLLFYTITIGFLVASFGIAMIVDDLGIILAMVGATGSTLVSYILPGLIYIKMMKNRHHGGVTTDWSMIGAYIQLIVGCLIMPVALYFVLIGSARE